MTDPIKFEMIEASGGKPLLPKKWSELSAMTISYGHGLSATPMHMAVGYAAIANGGLRIQPSLLKGGAGAEPVRVMSAASAANSVKCCAVLSPMAPHPWVKLRATRCG